MQCKRLWHLDTVYHLVDPDTSSIARKHHIFREPIMLHSIKSGLASKFGATSDDKERKKRLKRACSAAATALRTTLEIAKQVTGDVGVAAPGLQTGITGLLFVLDVVKVDFRYTS